MAPVGLSAVVGHSGAFDIRWWPIEILALLFTL